MNRTLSRLLRMTNEFFFGDPDVDNESIVWFYGGCSLFVTFSIVFGTLYVVNFG